MDSYQNFCTSCAVYRDYTGFQRNSKGNLRKTCYRHAEKRALQVTKKRAMRVFDIWESFIKIIQE